MPPAHLAISDSTILLLALVLATFGILAVWRVLARLIEQETHLHDTKVKVASLQINYLERVRAFRDGTQVGEASDTTDDADVIVVS